MTDAFRNPILRGLLAFVVGYVMMGVLIPSPWFSAILAALLLITGAILFITYLPETMAVIRDGKIGDDRLSLLGIHLVSAGSVYAGSFGLLWYLAGSPPEWLSTPTSGFGRALMIGGFGLLIVSPTATREGIKLPRWWILAVAVLVVAIVAFLLGRQTSTPVAANHFRPVASLNECPDETPIAGNQGSRGWIYHVPGGAFYAATVAEDCFGTEEEARLAGYRPAGR